jgi:hypothetical protein
VEEQLTTMPLCQTCARPLFRYEPAEVFRLWKANMLHIYDDLCLTPVPALQCLLFLFVHGMSLDNIISIEVESAAIEHRLEAKISMAGSIPSGVAANRNNTIAITNISLHIHLPKTGYQF